MPTDPQTLLTQAQCYACYAQSTNHLLELALWSQWKNQVLTPIQPTVQAWVARAQANGGNPNPFTIQAVNTFWMALQAAGIDSKMWMVNCLVPDDWASLRTPLLTGTGGKSLWTDVNGTLSFINPSGKNGLIGNANGALSTGWIPFADIGVNTSDVGMSCYMYTSVGGNNAAYMGSRDNTTTTQFWMYTEFSVAVYNNGLGAGSMAINLYPFTGFACANVPTSGIGTLCIGNSGTNYVQRVTNPGMPSGAPPQIQDWYVLAIHESTGAITLPTGATISFVASHHALTFAQQQALFNAVQSLRVALGGGYV